MKYYLILASLLFITACGSSKKTTKRRVNLSPVTISASDSRYRATAERTWDITHTEVDISFNFENKTARATATLDMHPYFYNSDKIVLDAKSMGVRNVASAGQNLKTDHRNDSLIIYLDREYHRTESLQLTISYVAEPNTSQSDGSAAIRDDRGLYFINTDGAVPGKPVQIWTQGETQATSHWVPTIDQPNERFTFTLNITVPAEYTTLSNGERTNSSAKEDGTRTDTWEMKKEVQPYVMMMAIGKFSYVQDEPWKGKEVSYYVEPEYEQYAKDMFSNTPEMMDFFSNITGVPYPWNKYSQVVVRDYVSGAMENTSASLFGEFIQQTKREIEDENHEDVVAHELFHQWFGDYVTAESWSNLTLNESFANYSEQLWRNYKYGKASAEKLAIDDFKAYLNASRGNDDPLVRFYYNDKEDMFDRISYQKGGAILHYLHGLLGDSAFYRAMNIYLTKNALQPAEAHDWRMAVEEASGKDWNWFFDQWYFRGGHPILEVKYKFDDNDKKATVTFTQKQDELYRLPLRIKIASGSDTMSEIVLIEETTTTLTYPYFDSIRPAIIPDAEHWLVGELQDDKTKEHWLRHYQACGEQDYIAKRQAISATSKNLGNATVQELYKKAIFDNLEHIRAHALNNLAEVEINNVRKLFEEDVLFLAKQDASRHVRAYANKVLGEWKPEGAEEHLYTALQDESYMVAAEALHAIGKIDEDTLYNVARSLLSDESQGELTGHVWVYMAFEGKPEDTGWIKKTYKQVLATGKNKLMFGTALYGYMINTTSDTAFAIALSAIENIALSENIAVYRSAVASGIFEVGYFFKDEVADATIKQDVDKANRRLNMARDAILRIEAAETDKENQKNFKTARENLFGK